MTIRDSPLIFKHFLVEVQQLLAQLAEIFSTRKLGLRCCRNAQTPLRSLQALTGIAGCCARAATLPPRRRAG
jgi:hypothetical protein